MHLNFGGSSIPELITALGFISGVEFLGTYLGEPVRLNMHPTMIFQTQKEQICTDNNQSVQTGIIKKQVPKG